MRAKRYASAQSRFFRIEHPQWGETTTKPVKSLDSVLDTLPQNVLSKAKRLVNTLKNTNRVGITDRNEISIDGEVIQGSNASDLIINVCRKRVNTTDGYNKFAQTLHESGIPSDILKKPKARPARWGKESNEPIYSGETSREPSIARSKRSHSPVERVSSRDSSSSSARFSEPIRPKESSVDLPLVYITPGRPNTRRRTKIKYETLF